mgnify:CR=1 FL=1
MKRQDPMNVAVIGLGYVGLPLALSYAMNGCKTVGVDVLPEKVQAINAGQSHMIEPYQGRTLQEILQDMLQSGFFRATNDYRQAAEQADHYIVTVGLPVTEHGPDDRHLMAACRSLGKVLKRGDTVLIRSTVVPGMTEEQILPLLAQESGLEPGVDFYLAYASERIAEGRAFEEFRTIPVVLGAINDISYEKAERLIGRVTQAEIVRSEIRIIETSKVVENLQRDVNIAMIHEVARLCQAAGMDTYELIRIANTHPRVNLLKPGPGVGGYCLPYALYYLLPFAEKLDVPLPLFSLARQENDRVPLRIVERLRSVSTSLGKEFSQTKAAVFGLAMKDYSSDDRVSPSMVIVERLLEHGVDVCAFDPEVPLHAGWQVTSAEQAVREADFLLLLTIQRPFELLDWNSLLGLMKQDPVVLDTKHFLKGRISKPHHYLGV